MVDDLNDAPSYLSMLTKSACWRQDCTTLTEEDRWSMGKDRHVTERDN